ncbi:MAG: hypothetical protein GX555_05435 [Actinomycetales bacterium]|nr:hypothetical protein [Actinomycetales bacterium]
MDAELRLLAERQGGLFLTSQALARGTGDTTLRKAVDRGHVLRLARGLHLLATHEAETADERHLQLARGGLLLMPDALLSHWTAVLAHGLPVLRVPSVARLRRPIRRQVIREGFVVDPNPGEAVTTEHGPTTAVDRAVLDLARLRGLEAGLVSADAALNAGLVTHQVLLDLAHALRGQGAGAARRTAELADGRIESVGESRLRYACLLGGIQLVPQVKIRNRDGEFVARVDFLVKDTKVAIEFDGKVKYADGDGRTLWNEKQREDALRRLGYTVVRVTWQDFEDPAALLARIREAVASSQLLAG